jgi:hypothetical protein
MRPTQPSICTCIRHMKTRSAESMTSDLHCYARWKITHGHHALKKGYRKSIETTPIRSYASSNQWGAICLRLRNHVHIEYMLWKRQSRLVLIFALIRLLNGLQWAVLPKQPCWILMLPCGSSRLRTFKACWFLRAGTSQKETSPGEDHVASLYLWSYSASKAPNSQDMVT